VASGNPKLWNRIFLGPRPPAQECANPSTPSRHVPAEPGSPCGDSPAAGEYVALMRPFSQFRAAKNRMVDHAGTVTLIEKM